MPRSSGDHSDSGPSFEIDLSTPAIAFVVFYVIMFLYYFPRAVRNKIPVFVILSLFCAIRVATFALDATVRGSDSVTLGLYIGVWALYDIGIFALLYSAYILVLDREIMSGNVVRNPVSRITSNRHFIRFILCVAVVTGIAAWVCGSQRNWSAVGLQEASVNIFLVATVLLAIQTGFQIHGERAALGRDSSQGVPRKAYEMYIPCLIAILLLIRGIYRTITISISADQSDAIWYSLGALPELLAVFLFAVTGLVPGEEDPVPPSHEDEEPKVTESA